MKELPHDAELEVIGITIGKSSEDIEVIEAAIPAPTMIYRGNGIFEEVTPSIRT
jgi:hypothetical protein